MAVMATLDIPGAVVSTMEIEHPDRPYTYETIEALRSFYGEQAGIFFIVGSDSFAEIHTWREPMRVLAKANLIVAARPGYDLANPSLFDLAVRKGASAESKGNQEQVGTNQTALTVIDLRKSPGPGMLDCDDGRTNVFLTEYVRRDISSTEIRRRIRAGVSIGDLVPEPVARYIQKYGLYRNTRNANSGICPGT